MTDLFNTPSRPFVVPNAARPRPWLPPAIVAIDREPQIVRDSGYKICIYIYICTIYIYTCIVALHVLLCIALHSLRLYYSYYKYTPIHTYVHLYVPTSSLDQTTCIYSGAFVAMPPSNTYQVQKT